MARTTHPRSRFDTSQEIQARAQSLSHQRDLRLGSATPASPSEARSLDDPQHRITFLVSIRRESLRVEG